MNHYYIDCVLKERREEEKREYLRRRLLKSADISRSGVLQKLWIGLRSRLSVPKWRLKIRMARIS